MRKILLTYFSFVIACLVVIIAFITATTYTQLAVAILLYPLLVFFAYRVLPLKSRQRILGTEAAQIHPAEKEAEKVETVKRETVGISDIDKRLFLKLIGGAGLTLFMFSIFNKKAEGILYKNIPASGIGKVTLEDTAGNKVNPAQNYPTDGFSISEIEDNVISFYGFTKLGGNWYIMRVDTATGSFRYVRGESNFPGSWTNRENLKYDYFNNVF